jgi:hypothetical protein
MSKERPPLPERLNNFVLVCSVHGKLGVVPHSLIKVLEEVHREAMGCIYEIKVFDKEEYEKNNY